MSIHPKTRIGRVELTVADLARSLGFYRGILGFDVDKSSATDGEARLLANGKELILLKESPGAKSQPEGTTGLYHYAILLPDRSSLGRILKKITTNGYPLWGASDHLVSEALYLDDPDGNGIEIYRDRPRHEWRRDANGNIEMATLRLDLRDLLEAGAGEGFNRMPEGTTIGHMHLHVGDLERAEEFYGNVLGLDVMARYSGAALFLSAGGYHHHLGVNIWAGRNAPPPPEGTAGLRSFEFAVPDTRELEKVANRLEESNIEYEKKDDGVNFRDPWGSGVVVVAR